MTSIELQRNIFFSPPRYLVPVWRYAGPSCCCKFASLARHAGILGLNSNSSGSLQHRHGLPWKDWWNDLEKCTLHTQLNIPLGDSEYHSCLDRVWALIQDHPEVVNAPMIMGKPLTLAVRNGRRDIAELLRFSGAVLRNSQADELLYEAAASGNWTCIKLLLFDSLGGLRKEPWTSVNARPKRHRGTPVDVARSRGHTVCEDLLRKAGGRPSLHVGAMYAEPDVVSAWLTEGANVDECDSSGATPLWHAARGVTNGFGRSYSFSSIKGADGNEDERSRCIELLLEAQATVDALPITLETPLLVAARRGSEQHCLQLLKARASLETRDRDGRTPLDCAANEQVLRALLSERVSQSQRVDVPPFNGVNPAICGWLARPLPHCTNSIPGAAFLPFPQAASHVFDENGVPLQEGQWSTSPAHMLDFSAHYR